MAQCQTSALTASPLTEEEVGSRIWLFAQGVWRLRGPSVLGMPHFFLIPPCTPHPPEQRETWDRMSIFGVWFHPFFGAITGTHNWPPCFFYTAKRALLSGDDHPTFEFLHFYHRYIILPSTIWGIFFRFFRNILSMSKHYWTTCLNNSFHKLINLAILNFLITLDLESKHNLK